MRYIFAAILSMAFHAVAFADIEAAIAQYNQASSAGTDIERVSAAKGLGDAVMANPADADASILAHEAAWTLCRLGDCAEAQPIAAFALTLPEVEGGVNMSIRQLLSNYVDWTLKDSSKTRKTLDAALEATKGTPPSALSVTAHKARVERNTLKEDWRGQRETAARAAAHLEPISDVVGPLWSDFSQVANMAEFFYDPDVDQLYAQAHLEGRFGEMRALNEEDLDWLDTAYWRASTWRIAMNAYFSSEPGRKPDGGRVDDILLSYGIDRSVRHDTLEDVGEDEDGGLQLPFCPGDFDMTPRLEYPRSAQRKGMVGAVIAQISVEAGKVSDVRVLGSVPDAGFTAEAADTVAQWNWIVSDGTPGIDCGLDRENIVLPMAFQLD